jgi:hypothetical protein
MKGVYREVFGGDWIEKDTTEMALEKLGLSISHWNEEDKAWARQVLLDADRRWLEQKLLMMPCSETIN